MSEWPSVDLNSLRVLDALLRTESTVQAARELGLTQSAVSHALGRLREIFSDPLFIRVGRRLVPTERARELSSTLGDARAAIDRVFAPRASFDPRSLRASFRIACADYGELVVLPKLLDALSEEAPGVELTTYAPGDALEQELQRGRADLALGGRFAERAGLVHRALFRDHFVCVRRADAPRLTLTRYLEDRHVLVSPRGLPGGIVDELLEGMGHTRRVVLRTPTFQTALAIVTRTELSTTVPRTLAEAYVEHANVMISKLPFEAPELRFGMMFSVSRKDDASHRWLRERIAALVIRRGRSPKE